MSTQTPLIEITELAAQKAAGMLKERGIENGALRVFVVGGGCSGYQYGMALANESEEGDQVIDFGGVRFLVDSESAPLVEGAQIDYVEGLMRSGFVISNPNMHSGGGGCACGGGGGGCGGGGCGCGGH